MTNDSLPQIVRTVGHDLRNQLSVMRNSVYYLNMKVDPSHPKAAKHLGLLLESIDRTSHTIENLMDLALVKEPQREHVDVNALVLRALQESPMPADTQVEQRLGERLGAAFIDASQVRRALGNLLLFQYARLHPGDVIRVSTRQHDGRLIVEMQDTGLGLSPQEIEDLDRIETGQPEHLNIIVAKAILLENHGGLEIETRGGTGICLTVYLPIRPGGIPSIRTAGRGGATPLEN